MRKLVATKQVRESLRLIGSRSKDTGADRAVFSFANKDTHEQETEAVKDLDPHQRTYRVYSFSAKESLT